MEVVVDLEKVVVTFDAIDDLDRISVRVAVPVSASSGDEAAVHRLGDVLAATNVGALDGDSVSRAWINAAAARFHAAGQVGEGWGDRLEARLASREQRGGRDELEATVVWPGDR